MKGRLIAAFAVVYFQLWLQGFIQFDDLQVHWAIAGLEVHRDFWFYHWRPCCLTAGPLSAGWFHQRKAIQFLWYINQLECMTNCLMSLQTQYGDFSQSGNEAEHLNFLVWCCCILPLSWIKFAGYLLGPLYKFCAFSTFSQTVKEYILQNTQKFSWLYYFLIL